MAEGGDRSFHQDLAMTFQSGFALYAESMGKGERIPIASQASGGRNGSAGKISVFQAATSFVTTIIGAGILSFPGAFAKAGWVYSWAILITSALIVAEIGRVIEEAIQLVEKRMKRGEVFPFDQVSRYEDLCEVAFGKVGQHLAFVLVNGYLLLMGGAFMILIGSSLNFLFEVEVQSAIIGAGILFLPVSLLNDTSIIANLSVVGVIASVIYAFAIGVGGLQVASWTDAKDRQTVTFIDSSQLQDLGMVFAVMLLGFTYQLVAPNVRADMQKPEEMPKAISIAVTVVLIVYGTAGTLGYYGWGENVKGNVLRSMNLPDGSPMVAGLLLSGAVVCNLLVTFPIIMNCVYRAVEATIFEGYSCTSRIVLCLAALATGLYVPYFMEFLGLVGSVLGVAVGIFLPVACYWTLAKKESEADKDFNPQGEIPKVLGHVVIVILGTIVLCVGTYSSLDELMKAFANGS
jgi:vesicular inhibitory amino acid transporter